VAQHPQWQQRQTTTALLRIAIVDGEHARFVQAHADGELRTIGSLDSVSAHLRSRDIGTDKPRGSFESSASASCRRLICINAAVAFQRQRRLPDTATIIEGKSTWQRHLLK
jgi:protein required for attachment to host cells